MDLSTIPHNPGCYLFKDSGGTILYIGKAKDIRKRVSSYFHKNDHDAKTQMLVKKILDVDFIVTDTEVEALLLEANLIKKHRPKYNINLKDNKRYAYIKVTDEKFPRLVVSRKKTNKGSYYGPFVSGEARKYILELLQKTFQIRTCRRLPKRACLRYHINLCTAPCIGEIDEEDYAKDVDRAERVLKGHTYQLLGELNTEMDRASQDRNFEHALKLRNQIQALQWLEEKQKVERDKKYNEDIINYLIKEDRVYLMLFNIYKGTLENKQEFDFDYDDRFLEQFLIQYYDDNPVPREVILPKKADDVVEHYLRKQRDGAVRIKVPRRGEKKKLLNLVRKNIEISFFGDLEKLKDLRKKLRMQDLPRVIECFDISHLSGTATTASMVQFRNAKPDKNNYRRYKIRTVEKIDDFKAMAEVVRRRYKRLLEEQQSLPDLIVIDGGKGQLTAAFRELERLGTRIPIIALAKRMEEIYVPGRKYPFKYDKDSKGLHLLREIRDEAHRFAIKYNKKLRSMKIRDNS